ncbi:membrane protein, putative [Thioalkalivibrio nitratireducens DSM 14787]|uniref:Membrane protein, putative n=1 Tax=Thioalkalivibrio nitratireducens (strain DSM 14787 / UNIQEM 213 / ALEN2) TaxID=1255043 RepID=L0DX51_THIND|nr:ceramidase domain-containing protein [Thioalkalivibrio nitratireducens]AGA33545.1 membrane protein, putative [Thioalkalivibrio nitratireducens DSM 14787]
MTPYYCERTAPGWFAEPLNTASGLAYFVAAWQSWKQLERARWREQWDLHLLAALMAAVGLAAVLWHASGIAWLHWLDRAALGAFVIAYWSVFLVRTQRLGPGGVSIAWLLTAIGLAALATGLPLEVFGGTGGYVPLLALLLVGIGLAARVDRRLARDLLLASAIFLLALVVRALDLMLCDWAVVGTHWLWHLLTAGVLFVLVDGMIRHVRLREMQAAQAAG